MAYSSEYGLHQFADAPDIIAAGLGYKRCHLRPFPDHLVLFHTLVVGLPYAPETGIVAAESEEQPLPLVSIKKLPFVIQITIIKDPRSNIPFEIFQVHDRGILLADLLEGRWHDLHDANCTGLAPGMGIKTRFGDSLGLEPAPVHRGAEIVFAVLAEVLVILVGPVLVIHMLETTRQGHAWQRKQKQEPAGQTHSVQTQPDHQSHGRADANEHAHDHQAHGLIAFRELLGDAEIDDMTEDLASQPHEQQGQNTPHAGIKHIENKRVEGCGHIGLRNQGLPG